MEINKICACPKCNDSKKLVKLSDVISSRMPAAHDFARPIDFSVKFPDSPPPIPMAAISMWLIGFLSMVISFGIFIENPINHSTIGLILWNVFGILSILIGFLFKQNTRRSYEHYLAFKTRYQNAIARFNRCYYCPTDNIVFDPEDGSSATPDTYDEFLNRFPHPDPYQDLLTSVSKYHKSH